MFKYAMLVTLPVLAACSSDEPTAVVEDPIGNQCRQLAVTETGAQFDQTAAQPVSTDISGTAQYSVSVGEDSYLCVIASDGSVVSLQKS